MKLEEMLGEAYHEGMSIEEINTALSDKKFADLSTGNYVDVNKYNREIQELQSKLQTKESEIQKVNTSATNESTENQALINQLQEQLKALEKENNKSNAMASMSEAKSLLEIKDTDNEYTSFLDNISNLQKDTANVISGYFSKQIKNAYEKGKQDGIKNGLGDMGKQKGSSTNGGKTENFGKELAQKMMSSQTSTVDYFKRN